MEPFESGSREDLDALASLLRRLVRRMTRLEWASPRLMQIDVGQALSLLSRIPEYPKQPALHRTLADLLRELSKPRPDLFRYVLAVEESANEMDAELRDPQW